MTYPDDMFEAIKSATFDPPPLYCRACGSKMVKVEHKLGWTTYGARVIIPGWRCQKSVGKLRFLRGYHDDVRATVFGKHGHWESPDWL